MAWPQVDALIPFCIGGMLSRRPTGCVAWRREDWPSWQAARRSLWAFWTSPFGPALSVRRPQGRRRRQPGRLSRRRTEGMRTDRAGDAYAERNQSIL